MVILENGVLISGVESAGAGGATAANQVTGNNSLANLQSKSSMVVSEVTVATTAVSYSAGDVVGTIMTLSSVNVSGETTARLESLSVSEEGGQTPGLTFYIFRETPSGGTYTNDSAIAWNASDMARRVGMVKVIGADWNTVGSKSMATLGRLSQVLTSLNTNYFLLCIADTAYTSASTNQLTVKLGFSRQS